MNKKRKTMETDYDMVNEDTKDFDWKNGYIAIKQKLIESEDRANKMERLVEDLKTKFKKHSVVTTLQCAGNRSIARSDRNRNGAH